VPPPSFGCEAIDVVRADGLVKGVRCRTENGAELELEAELVVGADGSASRMRAALGIGSRRFSGTDRYLLGTVDVSRATRDVEIYCGVGYANGTAPLRDGTYFWDVVRGANTAPVEAGNLEAWRAIYRRRVRCADEFVYAVERWEQLMLVDVRTFWAAERVAPGAALVGDAAGAVHPHSGQGANLALEDAVALGAAMAAASGDLSARLARFARTRQRKLRRYVLWSLLAAGSFDGPNAAWRAMRRYGFLWNRVGPVRRELLRRQAGLA
jgi:2-polyprenyl-6-methoxyphenol hydroxylase-like FAD-dependent oxidoreductase